MKTRLIMMVIAVYSMICCTSGTAAARSYELPMTLDYAMMESLVIAGYYNEPGKSILVTDEDSGCTTVVLSEPKFSRSNGQLTFETRVAVKAGKMILKKCIPPIRWEGYLVLYQKPVINPADWTLSFKAVDSHLLTADRKPARVAGIVWNMIKDNVYGYLADIKIDLAPPVKQLKEFLGPLFTGLQSREALSILTSIRPDAIEVKAHGLRLDNRVDIPDKWIVAKGPEPERELTGEEIDVFISVWEKWDTFLIKILLSLLKQPLSEEERQILLDTVLETRYGFIEELSHPVHGKEFVRSQFMDAWEGIHSIFRRHLSNDPAGDPNKSLLSYLAFFTASDALRSLDAVGPSLGIEITNDGFTRLVRLLITEGPDEIEPQEESDPRLRELLGIKPWQDFGRTSMLPRMETDETNAFADRFLLLFKPGHAYASEGSQPLLSEEEMKKWLFERSYFDEHINNMVELLGPIGNATLQESKLPKKHHALFKRMVLATAWQETCLRHFVRDRDGGITYIRSYNNSSVGIMQVNERIWKGLYDINRLRWDIRYNAAAGCEILDIYFNRYALRYMKKLQNTDSWSDEKFAGSIYAMYNGGPKQFRKFLSRHENKTLYKSDKLFRQKYRWVDKENWSKLSDCLL